MAQALVLQINEVLDDPNLEMPILGAFAMDIVKQGTGSGYAYFGVTVTAPTLVKVAGCEIYDLTGTTPMSEYTFPTGSTTIRIKSVADRGRLLLKDIENVTAIGSSAYGIFKYTDSANSPYCVLNINEFGTKFVTYNGGYDTKVILTGDVNRFFSKSTFIAYCNFITGLEARMKGDARTNNLLKQLIQIFWYAPLNNTDMKVNIGMLRASAAINIQFGELYGKLADIRTTMTSYFVYGGAKDFTTGDIADIPTSVTSINLESRANHTYRGGRAWTNLARFVIRKTVFDSTTTALLLRDIANGTIVSGALISFTGTVTTEAQTYIATIQSKGGTVSILNP